MKKTTPKRSKAKPVIHDQWIEVRKVGQRFVTLFFPSNEEFERTRLERKPAPTLIYRRFNFVDGVPAEYLWTMPTVQVQQWGGLFVQRIPVEAWPDVLASDRSLNHARAHSSSVTVQRPENLGPCLCEACVQEEEDLWDQEQNQ